MNTSTMKRFLQDKQNLQIIGVICFFIFSIVFFLNALGFIQIFPKAAPTSKDTEATKLEAPPTPVPTEEPEPTEALTPTKVPTIIKSVTVKPTTTIAPTSAPSPTLTPPAPTSIPNTPTPIPPTPTDTPPTSIPTEIPTISP